MLIWLQSETFCCAVALINHISSCVCVCVWEGDLKFYFSTCSLSIRPHWKKPCLQVSSLPLFLSAACYPSREVDVTSLGLFYSAPESSSRVSFGVTDRDNICNTCPWERRLLWKWIPSQQKHCCHSPLLSFPPHNSISGSYSGMAW